MMHKATINVSSPIWGEDIRTVEHEDIHMFHATIAGMVEGITSCGSVVTRLTFEREDA